MTLKRAAWLASAMSIAIPCVASADGTQAATTFSDAIEEAFAGRILCEPRHRMKVIICAANTTAAEADKLVKMFVFMGQAYDVGLYGWKITLVTVDDYVVTHGF